MKGPLRAASASQLADNRQAQQAQEGQAARQRVQGKPHKSRHEVCMGAQLDVLLRPRAEGWLPGLQGRKRFWTGGDRVDGYGKRQARGGGRGRGSRGGRKAGRGAS